MAKIFHFGHQLGRWMDSDPGQQSRCFCHFDRHFVVHPVLHRLKCKICKMIQNLICALISASDIEKTRSWKALGPYEISRVRKKSISISSAYPFIYNNMGGEARLSNALLAPGSSRGTNKEILLGRRCILWRFYLLFSENLNQSQSSFSLNDGLPLWCHSKITCTEKTKSCLCCAHWPIFGNMLLKRSP